MIERALIWAGRLLVPLVVLVAIGAFSRLEVGRPPEQGLLRLAWRMVGAKARVCRDYTEQERATIPRHMQGLGQKCDQTVLIYRLRVSIDGQPAHDEIVYPGGLRGDRPLFVQLDFPLAPGMHAVRISFVPTAEADADDARSEAEDAARSVALIEAPRFLLERELGLRPGHIVLVDLDERGGQFLLVRR